MSQMLVPTLLMAVIAAALFIFAYCKGDGSHMIALKTGTKLLLDTAPLLIFAFLIAGLVPVLLPPPLVQKWIGAESGIRGIFMGTLAGAISPGGPYVSLPLALGLLRAGAGVGAMVAYLTAWSLIAFARLPMEIGILGWKLTLIRLACTFFFAPIAGLLATLFFGKVNISVGT